MNTATLPTPPASTQDALEVLQSDHRRLGALFADYARLTNEGAADADRNGMLARIGALLRAHTQIESELFYPALRDAGLSQEGEPADHGALLNDLTDLVESHVGDTDFDVRVARLGDKVAAHTEQVERQLFPLASGALDLKELGTRLALRRGQLLGDQGAD